MRQHHLGHLPGRQASLVSSGVPLFPRGATIPIPTGLAVLRSAEPVALGRWHRVTAERVHKDGTLTVDDTAPVKRSSPGKSQGLNLRTPLYLGGSEPPLRPPTNATFRGCIGEVRPAPTPSENPPCPGLGARR